MSSPIEDVRVQFHDGEWVYYPRVTFKDNGWLGAFDGEEWNYFPDHRISRVRSLSGED